MTQDSRRTLYLGEAPVAQGQLALAGGTAAWYSAACPGAHSANEDSAAVIAFGPDAGVLVVADGMGGERGGKEASNAAIKAMEAALDEADGDDVLLRSAILNGFEAANRAVLELGLGAGTTLAVVEINGGLARAYHVGDSPVLIVGQRGRIKLLTVAHSPVGFAVESGLLDADEAMHHDARHVVSNMVGSADMRIEVGSPIELARYDTILAASDGLADNLSVAETIELVRKGPLAGCMKLLVTNCHQRMLEPTDGEPSKPDDLTLLAYRRSPVRPARNAR